MDARTKVAVGVAKDQKNRPGRARRPESPDRPGRDTVPVTKVHSSVGPAHCDWQKAHFLSLGRARPPYGGDVRLRADAHDTGYRFHDRQLCYR